MKESITTRSGKIAVGDLIEIVHMDDEASRDYDSTTGRVTLIDDIGQLHGTWGGLALIPETDDLKKL